MPAWQTSLATIALPRTRLSSALRIVRGQRPLIAAAAVLAATLALGWGMAAPAAPGFALISGALHMPELGVLPAVAGAGLIAHHLARLSTLPRADPADSALGAALIACATLPGLSLWAILPAALAAIPGLFAAGGKRLVAAMVQCIAILSVLGAAGSEAVTCFAYAAMLAGGRIALLRPRSGAANDNPSMERAGQFSQLLAAQCCASGDSQSGSGQYGSFR
ncbi:hypothetical protein ACFQ1E_11110 [Sphingomonas canadensis]|uniref:Uncharacterized protein n=1 Tax=Sphingomonas canadensis TaxID=1219257 RepID=A0ABW3H619_9SPHN|nr:hypothetical protein [Sphingomonas canadensis]MCW3836331.1 hypothetical protein [Sphingomonas canadensis]